MRPEEFDIAEEGEAGIPAVVKNAVFLGATIHYFLEGSKGNEIEVIQSTDRLRLIPEGTVIRLKAKAEKINLFTKDGEQTLILESGG